MRRMLLELPEEFKPMEVLFTIHQLGKSITKLLPLHKKKKKRREVTLSHSLHLNLTNKRKNP